MCPFLSEELLRGCVVVFNFAEELLRSMMPPYVAEKLLRDTQTFARAGQKSVGVSKIVCVIYATCDSVCMCVWPCVDKFCLTAVYSNSLITFL